MGESMVERARIEAAIFQEKVRYGLFRVLLDGELSLRDLRRKGMSLRDTERFFLIDRDVTIGEVGVWAHVLGMRADIGVKRRRTCTG